MEVPEISGANKAVAMTVSARARIGAEKKDMRVAVIGSGLAGLTTAYLLRRQGVEVWILEKVSQGL